MVLLLIASGVFLLFTRTEPHPPKGTTTNSRQTVSLTTSTHTAATVSATPSTQAISTAQAVNATPTTTAPTPTPTPTPLVPQYTVVDHQAQAALPVDVTTTVSAQCASGEQMLSGGYSMSDRVNPVVDSYPSASDTWTVTAFSGFSNATLSVYVTCLQANFSAHVQIFSFTSNANNPTTFPCPSGSALTGGGFRGYAARAEPNGNGWLVKPFPGSTNTEYALCATTNLQPVAAQVLTFSVPPQTSSAIETLSCPAGTQIAGGGFTYDYQSPDVYANIPRGDAPTTAWSVGVYNNDSSNTQNASAWAICVRVPASVS